MKKDLAYYASLEYPYECYSGENELGDAFLVEFLDFDIKGTSEDYDEAVELAHKYLIKHIVNELKNGRELPNPREGKNFMKHREALVAYKNKDFNTALSIWKEESKIKNDQAMANLGLMYLKGEGVNKDFSKAKEWFEEASKYDNDSANFNLALMYQTKIGVEEDLEKAKEYFRRAVAKNHTQAAFRLALVLLQDRTKVDEVKEGFDCMLKAAQNGHTMASIQLTGMDKELPEGVELNHNFRAKEKEEQLEIINDALDRFIRPILVKDGGNIILIDYLNDPELEIRLAYQGACVGCSIASTGTYTMIADTMQKIIDPRVRIFIL
ncbi:NifU family protein [Arcobacter sp. LA11]|uniref:NifU family protein n=1 Tax=Arcobacter sp. LA11 TaxID=1898176 RepID=UPI0009347720|nr:NifU family protein [Arcobacter sp. LA11]